MTRFRALEDTCLGENFNKAGASRWYVGYALPTNSPAPHIVNAVTFWSWRTGNDIRNDNNVLGTTIGYRVWWDSASESGAYVPNRVMRCVVAYDRVWARLHVGYYQNHPDSIAVDAPRVLKKVLTHEFGHAVGMHHPTPGSIYTHTIMDIARRDTSARYVTSDSSFSSQSIGQFSTKGAQP